MDVDAAVADPLDWQPRKGSPPKRAAETREMYSKRIRAERNARHHRKKARERDASRPAAKVAAQAAAKPRRALPGPLRAERPSGDDGMQVFDPSRGGLRKFEPGRILGVALLPTTGDPGSGSYTSFRERYVDPDELRPREVRESEWREAPREEPEQRSTLRTTMGQRSFAPTDEQEINDCVRWLDGQPEIAGIDPDTIRAALANVLPGAVFSLAIEEPTPQRPARSVRPTTDEPVTFAPEDLAPIPEAT